MIVLLQTESVIFKDMEVLDSEDPDLRFLLSDVMLFFKSLLGDDISLRTKTGYRILHTYAPRAILKATKDLTFNDVFARILVWITATVWPNGVLIESSPTNPEFSDEERKQLRIRTERAVSKTVPKSVSVILGHAACEKLVQNLIRFLNDTHRLTEAFCLMLETTVDHLVSQKKTSSIKTLRNVFSAA